MIRFRCRLPRGALGCKRPFRHGLKTFLLSGAIASGSVLVQDATAETLADTLVAAYGNSNLLEQRRALLRAADEDVAQAYAALLPVVNFVTQANTSGPERNNDGRHWSGSVALSMDLTVFDNGVTDLAAKAAKETVLGLRAALVRIEQQILLDAVRAYMDVIRTAQSVALRENNVELITEELRAARDRFDVGEATRTDVSIAEARLSAARGNLAAAEGDLAVARETYRAVVGRQPDDLEWPVPVPATADSEKDAKGVAVRTHPQIKEAQRSVNAAEANVRRAHAARGFNVTTGLNLSIDDQSDHSYGAGLRATLPLYRGGLRPALRQMEARRDATRAALLQSVIDVELGVGTAWAMLQVSAARTEASRRQVTASQLAYEGVREEARFGSRTTLDVLDAEQELLDARSILIGSEVEQYLSRYSLLSAMGVLTVKDLGLDVVTYDPADHYSPANSGPRSIGSPSDRGRDLDRVQRALNGQ